MEKSRVQIYNDFIIKNDYEGLADYLETLKVPDEEMRTSLNNSIETFRRYGGIVSSILNSDIDQDTREKLEFSIQKEQGVFNENNRYANAYLKAKDNIGVVDRWFKDDDRSEFIGYAFDDEEIYNKFLDNAKIDVQYGTDVYKTKLEGDSRPVLMINKNKFKDDDFLNTVTSSLMSIPNKLSQVDAVDKILAVSVPAFDTIGFNKDGKKLFVTSGLERNQKLSYDMYNAATNAYTELMDAAYSKVIPSELVISGYMCEAQEKWDRARNAETVSTDDYNKETRRIADYYERMLAGFSLTNSKYSESYMIKPGANSQTLELISEEDKGEWTNNIRLALNENRLKYQSATSGGRVGTLLTIVSKVLGGELNKEDYAKGTQIFVPGLFEDDARKVLDKNDDAKLLTELSDHIAFNHPYKLLSGGRLIQFSNDERATYNNGNGFETRLDPEDVRYLMHEDVLLKGGIKEAKNILQYDKYGNKMFGQKVIVSLLNNWANTIFAKLNNVNSYADLENYKQIPYFADKYEKDIRRYNELMLNALGLDEEGNPTR